MRGGGSVPPGMPEQSHQQPQQTLQSQVRILCAPRVSVHEWAEGGWMSGGSGFGAHMARGIYALHEANSQSRRMR